MSYPRYAIKIKSAYKSVNGRDHVFAWRHGADWIVETRQEGMKKSQFFNDTFDAASAVITHSSRLCLGNLLPVEPGLRLAHRLTEYMEDHK